MNEVASYGGFPVRYPHWRFGMEYEQLAKSAEYGLSRIYEMVINNTPSIAYLLEGMEMEAQVQGVRVPLGRVFEVQARHYSQHTDNVKKKFELEDWPEE